MSRSKRWDFSGKLLYEQLELDLDWGSEPWEGRAPRGLTKISGSTCVVDKSDVECEGASRYGHDPSGAQYNLYIYGESL